MLTLPTSSGGRRTHSYFEKIIFLSHWCWGPYQNCWSHICVSSKIHSCWGSYRNWWLAVVSSIFHRQFENSLISPRISSAAASSTLLRLFLYNLSRLDTYWAFSTFVPISFLIVSDFFPSTRDAQLLMSWPRKLLSFLASCYHRWDH